MILKIGNTEYSFWWTHLAPTQTVCHLSVDRKLDDEHYFNAIARAHPSDQFSKEMGRRRSLARLLKTANFGKQARTLIWETYWKRLPQKKQPKFKGVHGDRGGDAKGVTGGSSTVPGEGA